MRGKVFRLNVGSGGGRDKGSVTMARFVERFGVRGDFHAGRGAREVSLMAKESLERMERAGTEAYPGKYGENITTEGISLVEIPPGTVLTVGDVVRLEVFEIRKPLGDPTAVYYYEDGEKRRLDVVFARVRRGGVVSEGDPVTGI